MADGAAFISDVTRSCYGYKLGLARWRMRGYIGVRVREWWSMIMFSWRPKLFSGKLLVLIARVGTQVSFDLVYSSLGRCPGQF